MKNNSVTIYSLSPADVRAYALALALAVGNVLLPMLCHLVPDGGKIFLPVFFFTFVGAYKYGFTVGLAAGILSPLLNHWLTGMPGQLMLVQMTVQSVLLAAAASFTAHKSHSASFAVLAMPVVIAQSLGLLAEACIMPVTAPFFTTFCMAIPGMALQTFLGGWFIKRL